jgi:hypothetical protein
LEVGIVKDTHRSTARMTRGGGEGDLRGLLLLLLAVVLALGLLHALLFLTLSRRSGDGMRLFRVERVVPRASADLAQS